MALLSLIAKLGLDKTGFDAGLNAAGKKASAFGGMLKSQLAAAFSVTAITAYAKHVIDLGSKFNDTAKKMNIGTDAVQEFAYAAKLSGTDIDTVARSFIELGRARAEALKNPGGDAANAFKSLGVDPSQSTEKIFRDIAAKFQSTDFGDNEGVITKLLFGRGGPELLPMFKAGLAEAAAEAARLGIIMEQGTVKQLDEAGDAIDRMIEQTRGPFLEAVTAVATVLTEVFKVGSDFFNKATDFWAGAANAVGDLKPKDLLNPAGVVLKLGGAGFEQMGQGIIDRAEEAGEKAVAAMAGNAAEKRERGQFIVPAAIGGGAGIKSASFASNPTAADQLGRIGAFSGGGTGNMQSDIKGILQVMKDVKIALTQRGIKVQEF